jgi:AraC family transcriptional regulator, transcriptional activator of pobA
VRIRSLSVLKSSLSDLYWEITIINRKKKMSEIIYNLDLTHEGNAIPFVIRTMVTQETIQHGISESPHRHNFYTIIWPYEVKGKHIIDFKEYPIVSDGIFFVNPWQVHQVITEPSPQGVVILFTPEFLQKNSIKEDFISNLRLFRDSDETPPLPVDSAMKVQLKTFVDGMFQAFSSSDEMRYDTIGAYLKLFLITCNGHCSLYPDVNPQNMEVGRSLIRKFKDLVEAHFHEWHQVQNYAEKLNVTPSYLNEVVKSSISQSAKDFIQHRVILEAKRMSLFTSKSGKEIGFDLGFEDPSHFSKFFKTNTGISLVEFKESLSV